MNTELLDPANGHRDFFWGGRNSLSTATIDKNFSREEETARCFERDNILEQPRAGAAYWRFKAPVVDGLPHLGFCLQTLMVSYQRMTAGTAPISRVVMLYRDGIMGNWRMYVASMVVTRTA